jgi:ketosteroid isomerase-like protein
MAISDSADDVVAIRHVSDKWVRAVAENDMATLGRLLSDDVVIVHGDGRQIIGREAAIKDLAESLGKFKVGQASTHEETVVSGDWAFDRSIVDTEVIAHETGIGRTFKSRTLTLLRRSGSGTWQVARVIGVVITEQ